MPTGYYKISGLPMKPPSRKGIHLTEEQKEKMRGKPSWNKGKKLSKKHCKNLSLSHKGHTPWNKGKIGVQKGLKGDKNHFWKGGLTQKNYSKRVEIMNSIEYKLWRKSVFERDNFTCQKYGTNGGLLAAHHINNFIDFTELRFAIDNGITFSDKAHREFHKKYGRKNNTREQLEEFLRK